MEKTIEQKVAEAILQKEVKVKVGDKEYTAAPPSTATLILVSEAVSFLPHIKLDPDNVVGDCLSIAKDCRALGDVAAVLLLGARHINDTVETRHTENKRYLWGLIRHKRTVIREETKREVVAREILETLSPADLNSLLAQLLQGMEIADFFGLTTFLTEINLLRRTKKVEN